MIKKTLGLLIIGIGIINITNGMAYIGTFGDNMLMSTNTNNYINIDSNLNFSTVEKTSENYRDNILSVNYTSSRGKFVAGRKNGQLYLYGKDGNKINQGYVSKVYKCNQERGTANYGGNSLGQIVPQFSNCTDTLQTPNDYITNNINNFTYYAFGYNPTQNTALCFTDVQLPDYGGNRYIDWYCMQADTSTSENFSITDNTTPDVILTTFGFGQSPFNGGGNNQIQVIRTGHNYYCPTFKQLLSTYPINYSTGLCYNGTLKYENGQLTTVQKQDIFTVFTNYEEYQNYVYLYNNYCTGPATQTACENAFNGEREKYSIISNAYNKNVDDKKMWQYCDMALNYDLNTTTCTAGTGTLEEIGVAPTPENITDLIEQLNHIGDVQIPITGNILNKLLDEGETREDISAWNILGNLDQIKEKLTNIFEERTGTTGIIPDYIMWLIMVGLLLTVLLKK